jgi:serine/alanine adding enzyme
LSTSVSDVAAQETTTDLLRQGEGREWDNYVLAHPEGTLYHLSAWAKIIQRTYGHTAYYLTASRDLGRDSSLTANTGDASHRSSLARHPTLVGVLPLIHLKHFMFGNNLISVPYFDLGGILADDDVAARELLKKSLALAGEVGARRLELRHTKPSVEGHWGCDGSAIQISSDDKKWSGIIRSHKVRFILELPGTADRLMQGFKSKLRSQIHKSIRDGLEAEIGGIELLDDFYRVFSKNMRDLGSPVHSKGLMAHVLSQFGDKARIVLVRKERKVLAGSLIVGFRDIVENPWASALAEYRTLNANMLLYWTMLEYSCSHGYRFFDFGRSTPGEGTYRFKEQWGAKPEALHWHYFQQAFQSSRIDTADPGRFAGAIRCWQKLPVPLTKLIGPPIRKYIGL